MVGHKASSHSSASPSPPSVLPLRLPCLRSARLSSRTNFVAEFNYVLGRSLAIETGSTILNGGATFTENGSSFNVHNELEVEGKTGAETAAILEGWVGETKEGLAANWVVDSVTCA
ncbi:hypothetical protein NLJ89_g11940 [Agrocybe chaxingu]|uniref:Uncharacterized protein n=1 Tax=Agrocybe chaxingu TaxID=84603 RepID=A0A9W8JVE4_9AGAR|nr:hypothetical protein NLJ89_g11940 [Agrocybe chaxingu]